MEGREAERQTEFFELGSRELSSAPQWAQVDLRGLRVERVQEFGNVDLPDIKKLPKTSENAGWRT